jgi:outer membrane biosynthesis protein TonB
MPTLATLVVLAMASTAFGGQAAGGKAPATGQMTKPTIIKNVPPVYPEDARAARTQGQVVVEATVSAAGTVDRSAQAEIAA